MATADHDGGNSDGDKAQDGDAEREQERQAASALKERQVSAQELSNPIR
jgi:hypothetical protein